MSTIELQAEARKDIGRGASRRLRRLENKIPAIVYGGDKDPQTIHLSQNKVFKALENEGIYSSVFNLSIDGKDQQVILKDMQRHPFKPIILHMDLQRVSGKDVLVINIPLHFINEDISKGVKVGGLITHTMNQVEVRCQAKNLPEFIEVDMANVDMNDVVHLSSLKLPKSVELTIDVTTDASHDLPVASIHAPKVHAVEEEVNEEEGQETAEASEGDSEKPEEGKDEGKNAE
ncbi:MAG: 50S ribosomal protein L25/general stress protein Ctc [Tatlockia sp.]|nr:50S ribosomal protein L25/general stress protein Ctc [Tatlockia sp.]